MLAALMLFSLISCSEYEPVKSTDEEERVVMTMTIGKEKYEVRYELYRALFLNYKSEVDGGDESVWSSNDARKYVDRINEIIVDAAANIFSAIYICDTVVDFDVYSRKADKMVEEYVAESVEGGEGGEGFGSYEAYLAYLRSVNLNYSVQDLIYRYYIALEKIDEYYLGDTDADSITDDEIVMPNLESPFPSIRKFYFSDGFKRVLYAYFSEKALDNPDFSLDAFREDMLDAAKEGRRAVELLIGGRTAAQDVTTGIFISENTFNDALLDSIKSSAFELSDGEVGEVIHVKSTGDATIDGYYILYAIEKSEEDFVSNFTQVRLSYLGDCLAEKLSSEKRTLISSVKYTEEYSSIDHKRISM